MADTLIDLNVATRGCCSIRGFSTPGNVDDISKLRPLTDELKKLINTCFKPNYGQPMLVWATVGKNSRRKKLYNLLSLTDIPTDLKPRNTTKITDPVRRPEFVLRTGSYMIDLNRSFNTHCIRQKDPRHYRSAIKEQGVFGFPEEIRPKTAMTSTRNTVPPSLGGSYAKQLFKEPFLSKFLPYAHANVSQLKILVDYLDSPSNAYLINPLTGTSLDPYKEKEIVSGTLKEDHFNAARYRTKSSLQEPVMTRNLDGTINFSGTRSNYAENFTDEPYRLLEPTKTCEPYRNGLPFSKFPTSNYVEPTLTMEQYREQARENKVFGRKNREIFTAKTIL